MQVSWIEIHQVTRLAVDHDLRDSADARCNDRRLARHRLQDDQTKRLVDRRANEHRGVRVKMNQVLSRYEMVDPDQVASLGGDAAGKSRHLSGDFGRTRTAGPDHKLILRIQL